MTYMFHSMRGDVMTYMFHSMRGGGYDLYVS